MNKYFFVIILILLAAGAVFLAAKSNKNTAMNVAAPAEQPPQNSEIANVAPAPAENMLSVPLEKAAQRITKKPFGIFITPQNSPVQPERFRGYHTGTDFEILPGEENQDVPVFAICDGKIIYKNYVNGYGGVIIQSCTLDGQAVTVLYGHISLAKSPAQINGTYKKGDRIAILGQRFSQETNGERKHLHLGIHKGTKTELRGYVQNQSELSAWLDFQKVFGLK